MPPSRSSDSHPLVSVVVPVYNGERFLGACLESVFAQTWQAIDVVAVDDGSTDGSADVMTRFPDLRCLAQSNQGVAAARNRGIHAARGEIIALIDQDDLWLPGKIAAQMQVLLADPAVDYVLTRQERFLEDGIATPTWVRPHSLDGPVGGFEPSAALIRRAAFDRVGLFDTRFVQGSDAEWFFRATDAGLRVAVVDAPLLRRRIHADNNSRFTERSAAELRRIAFESIRRKRAGAAVTAPLPDASAAG
jgi:glycosyltransferase involved in cell wall biosynthesis